MADVATVTLTLSRPGFADYRLDYHNMTVEDFHKLQSAVVGALLELGDSEAGGKKSK